jgi:serine/threonine-protein kinase RsbW
MEQTPVSQKYLLTVKTDIYALANVQEWFQQFTEIPGKEWLQCNLVLTEGFTNVVCHAHEYLPEDTPIDIEVTLFPNALEIRIWDFGKPFDFHQKLESLTKERNEVFDIENIPTGGRGLIITAAIADELSYDRTTDGRNCLMIRKLYALENS